MISGLSLVGRSLQTLSLCPVERAIIILEMPVALEACSFLGCGASTPWLWLLAFVPDDFDPMGFGLALAVQEFCGFIFVVG